MRLARVHIVNFRCLRELTLDFDDVTVMVGANSTGKSSVLRALAWLFHGGALEPEDIWGADEAATAAVSATFTGFTVADRKVLGSYVINESATFTKSGAAGQEPKLTGRARAFLAFEGVRSKKTATPMKEAYNALRAERSELGLNSWTNLAAMTEYMTAWEAEHPDQLDEATISATHLFGFTGEGRLNQRFDFVLVPAVSDPEGETRDARGTLLRQFLDRAMGDQLPMKERLKELEQEVAARLTAIAGDEAGDSLRELSRRVTEELQRLVPGGSVILESKQAPFKVPEVAVGLRVEEGGMETEVGRQGHGFQRALLIAVMQQLAALGRQPRDAPAAAEAEQLELGDTPAATADPAALFLALEEPELYQHPSQARHFASTLAGLAEGGTSVQVAYATHSEHFVDPTRYERLRRFRRRGDAIVPTGEVIQATIAGVTARLAGIVDSNQVATRIRMTLRRQLAEAVFARAVLIGEGPTDCAFLQGVADRSGGFDVHGIAVVATSGKTQLPIPLAILAELGIPTYVVFDGDADLADRMRVEGRAEHEVEVAVRNSVRDNSRLLTALSAPPEDQPETAATSTYAVFRNRLEAEIEGWAVCAAEFRRCSDELGDWRTKSEDVYRLAAATAPGDPPALLSGIVAAVRALA